MTSKTMSGNSFIKSLLKGAASYGLILIFAGLAGVAFNVFLTFAGL